LSSFTAGGKQPINQAQPSLKISHLFEGLTVSRNFKLLCLLASLVLWLFVVYWVRHHEPLLHQVMGNAVLHSPTADADRQIVNRVKGAFPIKTSPQTGSVYQPDVSVTDNIVASATSNQSTPPTYASANQTYAYPSVGAGQAISAPTFEQAKFGLPRNYAASTGNNYSVAEPILTSSSRQMTLPMQTAAASYGNPITTLNHYYVPIHSANGTYLKTIANR
jgi:hypothetical protein